MAKKLVEEELCEERMKEVGDLKDQLSKVCNNHIPHLTQDITAIKISQSKQETNQKWHLRGMIGLYGLMGTILALVIEIFRNGAK